MGLTIHYSGKFNPTSSLSEMIGEVKNIAEVHDWDYHIFETKFPKGSLGKREFNSTIYGICFTPPECETVSLTFFSNGVMANFAMFDYWLRSKQKEDERLIYDNFTKTQFAGIEIHKLIIHLLRYISKKYFKKFSLQDEGHYWETNDEKVLQERFKECGDLLDGFCGALQTQKMEQGETIEKYLIRIFKEVHAGKKKGKTPGKKN